MANVLAEYFHGPSDVGTAKMLENQWSTPFTQQKEREKTDFSLFAQVFAAHAFRSNTYFNQLVLLRNESLARPFFWTSTTRQVLQQPKRTVWLQSAMQQAARYAAEYEEEYGDPLKNLSAILDKYEIDEADWEELRENLYG